MKRFTTLCFAVSLGLGALVGCGAEQTPAQKTPDPVMPDPDTTQDPPDPVPLPMGCSTKPVTMLAGSITSNQTLSCSVVITDNVDVAAGVTLTVEAGTQIKVASGKALTVKGTLITQGTTTEHVLFDGKDAQAAGTWSGLVVTATGNVQLAYTDVRAADVAFTSSPGSKYALSRVLIENSKRGFSLRSDGTIANSTYHGLGSAQSSSPIDITDASPSLTDLLVDNANRGIDHVIVNGATAKPKFDHVEITGCHCAFHFNAGGGIVVTNSYIHDVSYGVMIYGSKNTTFSNTNFENIQVNIGTCSSTGSVTSTGNWFLAGPALESGVCDKAPNTNTAQASAKLQGVGIRP